MEAGTPMSARVLNDFIDLIGKQAGIYRSMETVLSNGRATVINADVDAMNAAESDNTLLIEALEGLEMQRLELAKELAASLNCPVQTLRLRRLAGMVPEPFSSRLKEAYLNLLGVTRRVGKINRAYQVVITQALDITRGSIDFICGMAPHHSTYHATGKIQNRKQSGLFMSGAV